MTISILLLISIEAERKKKRSKRGFTHICLLNLSRAFAAKKKREGEIKSIIHARTPITLENDLFFSRSRYEHVSSM